MSAICANNPSSPFYRLAEGVYWYPDSVRCGVLQSGKTALFIDSGDGLALSQLDTLSVCTVEKVLFTHYHADQASGCWKFQAAGAHVLVPESEKTYFSDIETYWASSESQYHRYNLRPHRQALRQSVRVDGCVRDTDTFSFGSFRIEALHTPGHTDGSMTYVVKTGKETLAFVGDLLSGPGHIPDVYSLQRADGHPTDYHGFMGAYPHLMASLDRLLAVHADVLIPSHGDVITKPEQAIRQTKEHLQEVYFLYLQTSSSLHWFSQYDRLPEGMPALRQPVFPAPSWVLEFGQASRAILAADGSAFVLDCGLAESLAQLEHCVETGVIRRIDGIWVSHYHDDHVDHLAYLRQKYHCPIYCHKTFADIVAHPQAYLLPCLSNTPAPVDVTLSDGETILWKGYTLTNRYFPGQTKYHAALLAKHPTDPQTVFFIGDSFTPSGLDDYCALNINPIEKNDGYFYCLKLLEERQGDLLINSHQAGCFVLDSADIAFLRDKLAQRVRALEKLLTPEAMPYGLYPDWISAYPYCQTLRPGQTGWVSFSVANRTDKAEQYVLQIRWPAGIPAQPVTVALTIEPHTTRHVTAPFQLAENMPAGTYLAGLVLWKNGAFWGERHHAKLVVTDQA